MTLKPYEIDEDIYQRFEQRNNILFRRLWDKTFSHQGQIFETNIDHHLNSMKEGYSRIDFALVSAGWTVYERFPFAFAWHRETDYKGDYGPNWYKSKHKVIDQKLFTNKLKKAAKFFGASLVGITDINPKWIYKTGFIRPDSTSEAEAKKDIRSGDTSGSILDKPINLPEGVNKAIVIAIEMDDDAISTAPAQPASAASALCYSKMAFIISCVGEFIRNMGYRAIQCGNDTALSIPLAIDAGLGALGRLGLLITPEYGPRVRLCKVFTDMPLESDTPNLEFIEKINNYCKECNKCAEECENGAISVDIEPCFSQDSISNNSGVKKYYVSGEKCFEFWIENSGDCGNCIAACPFSKIKQKLTPNEFWKRL